MPHSECLFFPHKCAGINISFLLMGRSSPVVEKANSQTIFSGQVGGETLQGTEAAMRGWSGRPSQNLGQDSLISYSSVQRISWYCWLGNFVAYFAHPQSLDDSEKI
jgi:hypothetical protein